ncbi:MAG TPA: hypothetical protein VFE41_08680 [Acetobacteraceae bacterium]|nr:hypothetical protein [Acetobacteraceae bacterium]
MPGDDVLVVLVDQPCDATEEINRAERHNIGERQAVITDVGTAGDRRRIAPKK